MILQYPLRLLCCNVLLYTKKKKKAKLIVPNGFIDTFENFLESAQYLLSKLKIKGILS